MKKKPLAGGVGILIFILLCALLYTGSKNKNHEKTQVIRIGVSVYNREDIYISNIISYLQEIAKRYEKESGIKVRMDVSDAKESQNLQNDLIQSYLNLDYDVIILNMVDRSEAAGIIDKAMEKDIPIVFFNREPVGEDMQKWDKIYYVGFDAEKSAKLQAKIILDKYSKDPDSLDLNGDGVIQYIMFEGETRHQDSLIRTEQSIMALKEGGLQLEKLAGGIADWKRNQASVLMGQYIEEFGDEIELVISNNDEMALGAIEAFERAGIQFTNIVGIDKTPAGAEAVNKGLMLGTVDISAKGCAEAVFQISRCLALDIDINSQVTLTNGKYVWVEQQIYTTE